MVKRENEPKEGGREEGREGGKNKVHPQNLLICFMGMISRMVTISLPIFVVHTTPSLSPSIPPSLRQSRLVCVIVGIYISGDIILGLFHLYHPKSGLNRWKGGKEGGRRGGKGTLTLIISSSVSSSISGVVTVSSTSPSIILRCLSNACGKEKREGGEEEERDGCKEKER